VNDLRAGKPHSANGFGIRIRTGEAIVAVSPVEIREFAAQCLRWSQDTEDRSQRDLIYRVAQDWINTASALDRGMDRGMTLVGDLRRKLD
jgi:hypothetical protein